MAEVQDSLPDLPIGGLREITLRIPGEFFFCETISLPVALLNEVEKRPENSSERIEEFILESLSDTSFSPYPPEQLAWGFHSCSESGKVCVFATPLTRLKQLGWQNLDLFRRVFPSFISIFGQVRESSRMEFLLHEDTLTLACFAGGSSVPDEMVSLPLDHEGEEEFEATRAKLLSLVEVGKYTRVDEVRVATRVTRTTDGYFEFDHHWRESEPSVQSPDEGVRMSADELWNHDLRLPEFKSNEKNKRRRARARWKSMSYALVSAICLLLIFGGVKIGSIKLSDRRALSEEMSRQVPLVLESQKLLEKLRQNKLGGIDPFGALGRVAMHRGGSMENPDLWFSMAHFETRSHMKLEGEGKSVESVNTFLENLENAKVGRIRKGRSGEELRQIKSGSGKTSFDVELDLIEEEVAAARPSELSPPGIEEGVKGP